MRRETVITAAFYIDLLIYFYLPLTQLWRVVIIVGITAVFLAIFYKLYDRLMIWHGEDYPFEKEVKTANRNKKRCNYCGNPYIDMISAPGPYCSLSCLLIANRHTFGVLSISMIVLNQMVPLIWPLVPTFIFLHLIGIEYHRPSMRFRYFHRRNWLKKEKPELFGEGSTPDIPRSKKDRKQSMPERIQPTGHGTLIIKDIKREVKICCYQTARLEEKYCYCGRAVDDELQSAVF